MTLDEIAEKIQSKSKHDITEEYDQTFEAETALDDFVVVDDEYPFTGVTSMRIKDGQLMLKGTSPDDEATSDAYPRAMLALNKALPHTFKIEFQAACHKRGGDLNVFIANDKKGASGYELTFGSHGNTKNGVYVWAPPAIRPAPPYHRARMAKSSEMLPLAKNRKYDVKIERDGVQIRTYLDGTLVLECDDEYIFEYGDDEQAIAPIFDDDHRYLVFSTWANEIAIDNLTIRELAPHANLGLNAK